MIYDLEDRVEVIGLTASGLTFADLVIDTAFFCHRDLRVLLIGLAAENAILIVEFARSGQRQA